MGDEQNMNAHSSTTGNGLEDSFWILFAAFVALFGVVTLVFLRLIDQAGELPNRADKTIEDFTVPVENPLLTDEHLRADAQILNGIHRLHILEAIKRKYITTGNMVGAVGGTNPAMISGSQQALFSPTSNSQLQACLLQQSEIDVFISYRRSTGALLASLLKVHLQMRGFAVFIDIERLEAGAFDQKLLESIRSAKHFILVLSNKALDRCLGDGDRKDWIHKEICAALENNCNIVPVIDVDFEWPGPEDLPEDMRDVVKFNGVRWIHDYQDACVDKLARFLKRQNR